MAVSHIKSNTIGDFTGTITGFNSQGSTTTIAATNLVRPSDWNSAHNQFYTLSGNTNNASTASGTNVVLQGVGGVTLIGSTATIGISAAAPVTHKMFYPYDEAVQTATAIDQATLFINPLVVPNVQLDRVGLRVNYSNATNSTGSVTISQWFGVYTRTSDTLSLMHSTSNTNALTFSGTGGSWTLHSGARILTIPWTTTITQGDYWIGIGYRTTTANTNASFSQFRCSQVITTHAGVFGQATNASDQRRLGHGVFSVSTTALPASMAFSELRGTSTVAQRQPVFFFLSQSA